MAKKIVLIVRGGVVQAAYTKGIDGVEIGIMDFDNYDEASKEEAEAILSDLENGWKEAELIDLTEEEA